MAAAGSIVVDLLAKTGSFETDIARSGRALKKFQKDAEETARATKASFVGNLLAGFAKDAINELAGIPARLAGVVTGAIDAADHLNDLSKKTGIAVDTLGGIGFAAKQSGGDLDSVAAAAGKLNKTLAEAAAGNKEAVEFFKVLGLSAVDASGKTKKADVALAEIADRFASFEDGPEKAALALRGLGKAGADQIALLNEGGAALQANIDYFKRYSGVTAETAKAADQFNDTQAKIKLLQEAFGVTLASQSLPLLQTLADRFLAAKEQGDGFKGTADGIVDFLKGLTIAGAYVIDTFQGVGREIGAVAAQVKLIKDAIPSGGLSLINPQAALLTAFARASNTEGFKAISEAVKADGERAKKELDRFVKEVLNPFQNDPSNYSNEGRNRAKKLTQAPRLAATGGGAGSDNAAAELKKRLDSQLRLIKDFEKAQADAYQFGNQYVQGVYEDGLTTQIDLFAKQKSLRDAGLQNTIDSLDKEIAAQRKYIADLKSIPAPSAEAQEKRKVSILEAEERIKLAVQQRSEAVTKASATDILAAQAEAREARQLADAYDALRASALAASDNEFGAAQIRNAKQVADARRLIQQAGGDPKIADDLKAALDAQNAFNKAQKDAAAVSTRLQFAEERIALAVKTGAITENEGLQALGQARSRIVAQLEEQLAIQERLAASQPNNDALALSVERSRLELDKLKASLDPLKDKFDEVFKTAGANSIEQFLNSTKGFKDRIKDLFSGFGKEILQAINKNVAQEVAGKIFGKDGIFGGAGGALADAFRPKDIGDYITGIAGGTLNSINKGGQSSERQSILDLFKVKPTDAVDASFVSLQQAIDPTTASMLALQQAIEGIVGSPSANPAAISRPEFKVPEGEQQILDLFNGTSNAPSEAEKTQKDFTKATDKSALALADMAAAAARGGGALAQLPSIIRIISTLFSSSSSSNLGSIASAIGSFFGSNYSANGGVGYSNAAGISGGRAAGGPVMAGHAYTIGERGPETLVMGGQSGTVIPNGGRGLKVNVINQVGANVQTRTDENGDLEILLERAAEEGARRGHARVAADFARGTGQASSALKSRGVPLSGAIPRRS